MHEKKEARQKAVALTDEGAKLSAELFKNIVMNK